MLVTLLEHVLADECAPDGGSWWHPPPLRENLIHQLTTEPWWCGLVRGRVPSASDCVRSTVCVLLLALFLGFALLSNLY